MLVQKASSLNLWSHGDTVLQSITISESFTCIPLDKTVFVIHVKVYFPVELVLIVAFSV